MKHEFSTHIQTDSSFEWRITEFPPVLIIRTAYQNCLLSLQSQLKIPDHPTLYVLFAVIYKQQDTFHCAKRISSLISNELQFDHQTINYHEIHALFLVKRDSIPVLFGIALASTDDSIEEDESSIASIDIATISGIVIAAVVILIVFILMTRRIRFSRKRYCKGIILPMSELNSSNESMNNNSK